MLKDQENNGKEKNGLVTPNFGPLRGEFIGYLTKGP